MGVPLNLRTFVVFLLLSLPVNAAPLDVVHHPAPREPKLIPASWYETVKKAFPAPPAVGSTAQKEDETKQLAIIAKRTNKDCDEAMKEVKVSLSTMYGPQTGLLTVSKTHAWAPFFEQLRNDADYFVQKLKVDFPRKRPFLYVKGVTTCVPKEVTMAYPSGHATIARLYARVLASQDPANEAKYLARGDQIGEHRVLSGMHHPSDVTEGQRLGDLLYEEMLKSPNYQEALKELSHKG